MRLVANWRDVLRYAWSIRLYILAGLFSGLEVALPILDQFIDIPRGLFAALSFGCACIGLVARLVAQAKLGVKE